MRQMLLLAGILVLIPIIYLMGIKGMTFSEMKDLLLDRVSVAKE